MIDGLADFVTAFKSVTKGHIDLYSGEAKALRPWISSDFDTTEVVRLFDEADSPILSGILKKAYDTIRVYHRAYKISQQTREDYYRMAPLERAKDDRMLDVAVNNLHSVYAILTENLEVK